METALILVAGLLLALALAWGWRSSRQRAAGPGGARAIDPDDPWEAQAAAGATPVLDRSFLESRDKTFDPRGWDDSPDGSDAGDADADDWAVDGAAEDDLPATFDRDYLLRRQQGREPGEDA